MTSFDDQLYEQIRPGCISSARVVAALVMDLYPCSSVIDVGCGEGWWAQAFLDEGAEYALGIELERPTLTAPGIEFRHVDLTEKWMVHGRSFDLALCLEVAEHLPATASSVLVDALCEVAPVVLFSAAVPGQGGHGHLNEQWPDYWAGRFRARGYQVSGALRWLIWDDDRVEPWYRQNLLVATPEDDPDPLGLSETNQLRGELFGPTAFDDPIAVAHPTIFGWRVQESGR